MFNKFGRFFALIVVLIPFLRLATLALAAETPPGATFTVSVGSAFARSKPDLSAPKAQSVFAGRTFGLHARTPDARWLKLDAPGSATDVWVLAQWGMVSGRLDQVPVIAEPFGAVGEGAPSALPASVGGATTASPVALATTAAPRTSVAKAVAAALANDAVLPQVSARAREIYRYGLTLGNNPQAFSKVGDSLSVPPFFLASFDDPRLYRLGSHYAGLQVTIDQFSGMFARPSAAAHIGFTVKDVLDPRRADGQVCRGGESPLACEYRLNRPCLAFVSLGTNGAWLTNADFERDLRQIITFSVESGVVPILVTKADDLDGGRFNPSVAALAAEYQLPLWDYRRAVEDLPNHGLQADGAHPYWAPSNFDDPGRIWSGWQLRNLTALQALDRVWRGVR